MIIDWLEAHFIFFVIVVIFIGIVKIVAAYFYYRDVINFGDFFFLLFKWYNRNELEITDESWRVRYMKKLNFLSILFYLSLLAMIGAYGLIKLF